MLELCLSAHGPLCNQWNSNYYYIWLPIRNSYLLTTFSVKCQCIIGIRNQFVLKFPVILSSFSGFHGTLKMRIEYRESRILNSDPRSCIHPSSESTRAAWRAVRACGTQCMVLVQGFRIYLEHLEVRWVPKFDAELTRNSNSDLLNFKIIH